MSLAGQLTPVGCVVALSTGGGPSTHQVRGAARLGIDPRYGTVLICRGLPGMRLATTVVYHATSTSTPPPVDDALTHDVSMATALHQ